MKLSTLLISVLMAIIKLSQELPIPRPPSSSPTTSIEEEAQPSVQMEAWSPIPGIAALAKVGVKAVKVNIVKATKVVARTLDEAADAAPVNPKFTSNMIC